MVVGDRVFVSFISSVPGAPAMCSLTTQTAVDCEYNNKPIAIYSDCTIRGHGS